MTPFPSLENVPLTEGPIILTKPELTNTSNKKKEANSYLLRINYEEKLFQAHYSHYFIQLSPWKLHWRWIHNGFSWQSQLTIVWEIVRMIARVPSASDLFLHIVFSPQFQNTSTPHLNLSIFPIPVTYQNFPWDFWKLIRPFSRLLTYRDLHTLLPRFWKFRDH